MLAYLVGGQSFARLCLSQIILLILAIAYQAGHLPIIGLKNPDSCPTKSFFESGFLGITIVTFFIHLIQPMMHQRKFLKENTCFTTCVFLMIDMITVMLLWAKMHKVECEPFMRNILLTNLAISVAAALNLGISSHMV